MAVFEPRGIEMRTLAGLEQASKRWKSQNGLTYGQPHPNLLQPLPEVPVAVMSAAADGAVAQPPQTVALRVECHCLRVSAGWVQDLSLLDGEQEDLPVDQAQQFLEVVLGGQRAR